MKKLISLGLVITVGMFTVNSQEGEKNYKAVCASCHTIGKGRLVGPDLKNVHAKYDEAWLIKWIRSSQTMVKENDAKALAIFNEFKVPMPDNQQFTDENIRDIITYIKTRSEQPEATAAVSQAPASASSVMAVPPAKSGNIFFYVGIALVILFFLAVLLILARSVIILSGEVKTRDDNK